MQAQSSLRTLLFGAPLHGRGPGDVDALVAELNACLRGVLDLLAEEIGPCPSLDQATLEWQRLIDAPGGFEGVAVRRAALLFALHLMEAVRAHFAADEPELVADLEARVLPVVVPGFLAGMAQKPEALVILTSTMCEMWQGVPLGNAKVGGEGEEGGDAHG